MELGPRGACRARVRRWAITTTLVGLLSAAATGTASAATAAPGYTVADFATGFRNIPNGPGPVGLAFGPTGSVYVSDVPDGHIYEFGSAGGAADASTQINPSSPLPRDDVRGLAFGKNGELYAALAMSNQVLQIDPADGHLIRTLTTQIRCPVGLAVDPVSGDLFVTSPKCDTTIWRIHGTTVSPYVTNMPSVDGIAFSPDGELWAAAQTGNILRIGGTASATPGAVSVVGNIPQADGLAIQAAGGGAASALFVNGLDGRITRLDLSNQTTSPVMSGGTRGDFMVAGPDGALYATQTDRVLRVTSSSGGGGGIPGVVPTNPGKKRKRLRAADVIRLQSARGCLTRRRVRIRLVRFSGVKFVSAAVRVNGRKVKTVRGAALRKPITVRGMKGRRIKVKVAVKTSAGRTFSLSRRYRFCAGV